MNGRRCGSPALRGETHCYFHDCVEDPRRDYSLPFPEDATSLQYGVMMVIRMLISGHVEIKRCWALLYSLQIASANLKSFAAERAEREGLTSEKLAGRPLVAGDQKSRGRLSDQSLAGLLVQLMQRLIANGSNQEPPIMHTPEDFAVERKRPATALPQPGGKVRMERVGGVPRPPL
jgi:hypothetical protein